MFSYLLLYSGINHTCACLDGFTGDGFNCTNVDECTAGQPCHEDASCTDTVGSFNCTCDSKHIGDGKQSCTEATGKTTMTLNSKHRSADSTSSINGALNPSNVTFECY